MSVGGRAASSVVVVCVLASWSCGSEPTTPTEDTLVACTDGVDAERLSEAAAVAGRFDRRSAGRYCCRMSAGEDTVRWREMTQQDCLRIQAAAAVAFARLAWVRAAYLYGSAARRERPARDVDIGLLVAAVPAEWGAALAIGTELAELSGITDVPFDVRILNGGDPVFLNNVLRDGILLYEGDGEGDREARIRFEAEAMSRWLDFKPAWENVRAEVLRRWAGE